MIGTESRASPFVIILLVSLQKYYYVMEVE